MKLKLKPTLPGATFLPALLLLCCATNSYGIKIQVGLNDSFVPHEAKYAKTGLLLGIEGETKQRNKITVRSGLYFSSRAGGANDKKVWEDPGILALYDIDYSISYLEVPILIKYDWHMSGGILELVVGPSLSFPLINKSSAIFQKTIDESYWLGESDVVPPHDYLRMEDPPPEFLLNLSNSTIFWNVGMAYKINNVYFELRYSLGALNNAGYIEMNELVHTIHVIWGASLSK